MIGGKGMKKRFAEKFVSCAMTALLAFGMVPVSAFAEVGRDKAADEQPAASCVIARPLDGITLDGEPVVSKLGDVYLLGYEDEQTADAAVARLADSCVFIQKDAAMHAAEGEEAVTSETDAVYAKGDDPFTLASEAIAEIEEAQEADAGDEAAVDAAEAADVQEGTIAADPGLMDIQPFTPNEGDLQYAESEAEDNADEGTVLDENAQDGQDDGEPVDMSDVIGVVEVEAPDSEEAADADADGDDVVADMSASDSIDDVSGSDADAAVDEVEKQKVVAVVDSGASATGVDEALTLVGDKTEDENGHATKVISAIRGYAPDAKVVSIRVLDADGMGTVAATYAGIETAIAYGADIVNLSLYTPLDEESSAISAAVAEARAAGITVVAAAGNDGADASGYTPASAAGAIAAGACDAQGTRLVESNFGEDVDIYVAADSTSIAAASTTGWLAAHSDLANPLEDIAMQFGQGVFFDQADDPVGDEETADGQDDGQEAPADGDDEAPAQDNSEAQDGKPDADATDDAEDDAVEPEDGNADADDVEAPASEDADTGKKAVKAADTYTGTITSSRSIKVKKTELRSDLRWGGHYVDRTSSAVPANEVVLDGGWKLPLKDAKLQASGFKKGKPVKAQRKFNVTNGVDGEYYGVWLPFDSSYVKDKEVKVPGTFTLTWSDVGSDADGNRLDLVVTVSDIRLKTNDSGARKSKSICLMRNSRSTSYRGALMASARMQSVSGIGSLRCGASMEITAHLYVSGTKNDTAARYVMSFTDLDQPDGTRVARTYAKGAGYVEGVQLVSGFDGRAYLQQDVAQKERNGSDSWTNPGKASDGSATWGASCVRVDKGAAHFCATAAAGADGVDKHAGYYRSGFTTRTSGKRAFAFRWHGARCDTYLFMPYEGVKVRDRNDPAKKGTSDQAVVKKTVNDDGQRYATSKAADASKRTNTAFRTTDMPWKGAATYTFSAKPGYRVSKVTVVGYEGNAVKAPKKTYTKGAQLKSLSFAGTAPSGGFATVMDYDIVVTTAKVADAKATITAKKTLANGTLAAKQFKVGLYEKKSADAKPIATATNDASGNFTFSNLAALTYVYDDSQSYPMTKTYYLHEIAGTDKNTAYDDVWRQVTVTVSYNSSFAPSTSVSYKNLSTGSTGSSVTFSNAKVDPVTVKLEAKKVLTGKTLAANAYSFQLKNSAGTVLQTKKNAANGTVAFDALTFRYGPDAGKTYTYKISEVKGSDSEIEYDKHVETVTVKIARSGNKLTATVKYSGTGSANAPTFTNKYAVKQYGGVKVKKVSSTTNAALSGAEFSVYEGSFNTAAAAIASGNPVAKMTSGSDGTASLAANKLELGNYTVVETNPPSGYYMGGASGSSVTVQWCKKFTLSTAGEVLDLTGDPCKNAPKPPTNAAWPPKVTKAVTGKDLKGGEYTFRLVNPQTGAVLQTATNDADGNVTFKEIDFAESMKNRVYHYVIEEVDGGDAQTTYDKYWWQADVVRYVNNAVSNPQHRVNAIYTRHGAGDAKPSRFYDPCYSETPVPTAASSSNTLTLVYHANGATGIIGGSSGITELRDPLDTKDGYKYAGMNFRDAGINNYSDNPGGGSAYILERTGWIPTQFWRVGSENSNVRIHQDEAFPDGVKAMAAAMGLDLSRRSATVHLYAEWVPDDGTHAVWQTNMYGGLLEQSGGPRARFSNSYEPRSGVSVVKEDAPSGEGLAGAVFEVEGDETGANLYDSTGNKVTGPLRIETDENGVASTHATALVAGKKYKVREVSAPAGYGVDDPSWHQFTATSEDGEILAVGTWRDMPERHVGAKVTKADSTTREPLAGARFEIAPAETAARIYDENGQEVSGSIFIETGEDGTAQTYEQALIAGCTYKVREVAAPEGYSIADGEWHTFVAGSAMRDNVVHGTSAVELEGQAYAVFDDASKTLTFIRSTESHENGQDGTVKSITGAKYTGKVYAAFEELITDPRKYTGIGEVYQYDSGAIPWNGIRGQIEHVVIADGIRPKQTAFWFSNMPLLADVAGLSKLDTSQVNSMQQMFAGSVALEEVDVSSFDTSKVVSFGSMFYNTGITDVDASALETTSAKDTGWMFKNLASLKSVDISWMGNAGVELISDMFLNDDALETIIAAPAADFSGAASSSLMFQGCTSLTGAFGTAYDAAHTDAAYARIDGADGELGYFMPQQYLDGDITSLGTWLDAPLTCKATITIDKDLLMKTGVDAFDDIDGSAREFTFELHEGDADGKVLQSIQVPVTDGTGSAAFKALEYGIGDVGNHVYTVVEAPAEDARIQAQEATRQVTVAVSAVDGATRELVASIDGGTPAREVGSSYGFTNVYMPGFDVKVMKEDQAIDATGNHRPLKGAQFGIFEIAALGNGAQPALPALFTDATKFNAAFTPSEDRRTLAYDEEALAAAGAQLVTTVTSGADGIAMTEGQTLDAGKAYAVVELAAPVGYTLQLPNPTVYIIDDYAPDGSYAHMAYPSTTAAGGMAVEHKDVAGNAVAYTDTQAKNAYKITVGAAAASAMADADMVFDNARNDDPMGGVGIRKVDIESGVGLAGAEFWVWDEESFANAYRAYKEAKGIEANDDEFFAMMSGSYSPDEDFTVEEDDDDAEPAPSGGDAEEEGEENPYLVEPALMLDPTDATGATESTVSELAPGIYRIVEVRPPANYDGPAYDFEAANGGASGNIRVTVARDVITYADAAVANEYNPLEESTPLVAHKTLYRGTLEDGQFQFRLYAEDDEAFSHTLLATTNKADGTIDLGTFSYSTADDGIVKLADAEGHVFHEQSGVSPRDMFTYRLVEEIPAAATAEIDDVTWTFADYVAANGRMAADGIVWTAGGIGYDGSVKVVDVDVSVEEDSLLLDARWRDRFATFENEVEVPPETGGVMVKKVNQDGEPLDGAAFLVSGTRADNGLMYSTTMGSDEDGIAQLADDELPLGTYRVTEVSAPEGYAVNTTWFKEFTIEEAGQVVDFTLSEDDWCVDSKSAFPMPVTGQGGIALVLVLALAAVGAGMALRLRRKPKGE